MAGLFKVNKHVVAVCPAREALRVPGPIQARDHPRRANGDVRRGRTGPPGQAHLFARLALSRAAASSRTRPRKRRRRRELGGGNRHPAGRPARLSSGSTSTGSMRGAITSWSSSAGRGGAFAIPGCRTSRSRPAISLRPTRFRTMRALPPAAALPKSSTARRNRPIGEPALRPPARRDRRAPFWSRAPGGRTHVEPAPATTNPRP